jgi:PAS domain S-box-containing protein
VFGRILQDWTIALSRRISAPDGQFLGMVTAIINTQDLEDFFQAVAPDAQGSISLFRDDGVLLAHYPEANTVIGKSFADSEIMADIESLREAEVVHIRASAFDSVPRIAALNRVDGFPLVVNVTNTRNAILMSWRYRVVVILLITSAAMAFIALSGRLLTRQVTANMRLERLQAERDTASRSATQIRDLNATLEKSLQQIRVITDNLPVRIMYVDTDRRIRFINKTGRLWYAHPDDDIVGKSLFDVLRPDEMRATDDVFDVLAKGPHHFQRTVHHPDGNIRTLDILNLPDLGPDGKLRGYYGLATDVTERKKIEEQLRQSQKLEAVGSLTGGIAHDFNNLLTVILGNASLLAETMPPDSAEYAMAEMTRKAAEQGAQLTHRLLAFARRQALEPKAVNVNRLISGMDSLLRRSLTEEIEIKIKQTPDLWDAMIDPSQLENALLNLCINARDAMPNGGRIVIETANVHLDDDYANRNTEVTAGPYVMIAVSDTGVGISAENLSRVFDPFFTTKDIGKGTGLGLSMVFGFIKQSQGHVKIYSELGQGTTVRMYLPKIERTGEAVGEQTVPLSELYGSETILIVEDDDLVREHTINQFRRLGYDVLAAGNGADALDIVRNTPQIDLLFTDVIMPGGMNGRQLATAAREIRPSLKVLFTSGYTENAIVHHGRLDDGVQLLSKPYRLAELATKVRAVLNSSQD